MESNDLYDGEVMKYSVTLEKDDYVRFCNILRFFEEDLKNTAELVHSVETDKDYECVCRIRKKFNHAEKTRD